MRSMYTKIAIVGLVAPALAQKGPISLSPSFNEVPQGASREVDHNFPSLAFEKSSFAEVSGNGTHPNLFSNALVEILQKKTGKPLWIRIGGTSADQDHFNASQKQAVVRPDPPIEGKALWNYSIGPSYFEAFHNFNKSRFIWMVPMAHENGQHLSADGQKQTQLAVTAIGSKLELLELGNEPNLYDNHYQKMRPNSYDPAAYVAEALQHEKDVEANISGVPKDIKYQALAYASNRNNYTIWNTSLAFDADINKNGKIETVSRHYYQAVSGTDVTLRNTLLNHTVTMNKLSRFTSDVQYLHKNHASVEFVLGEVGSVIAPELKWEVQATFGNALWNVDMMLYAMSLNVNRVHMQSGQGFGYALWNSTTVRPTFYAQAMVSDFIGNDTSKSFKVKHIDLPGHDGTVAAYGGYVNDNLERLVLLNLQPYSQGPDGDRPSRKFEIKVPDVVRGARVERLMGPGSSATGGTSWAGKRWLKANDGVSTKIVDGGVSTITANDTLNVAVKNSEAVIVHMLRDERMPQ